MVVGFQVDIGSSVNLMNIEKLEELGITNVVPNSIIPSMTDRTKTEPLGQLLQVSFQIVG